MKLTRVGQLVVIGCVVVTLAGCKTMKWKRDDQTAPLRTEISDLESQLKQKDAEIESLRKSLARTTEDKYNTVKLSSSSDELSVVPSATQIQTALKNAGHDVAVDGKIGSATRRAIKDFQKVNGLVVDGKVGKKTWAALEPYLNKQ